MARTIEIHEHSMDQIKYIRIHNPYGAGQANRQICETIHKYLAQAEWDGIVIQFSMI